MLNNISRFITVAAVSMSVIFGSDVHAVFENGESMATKEESNLNLRLLMMQDGDNTVQANVLVEQGARPDHTDDNHQTLLHDAARAGNISNMEWLVRTHNLNVMAQDYYNDTPAHHAARRGNREAIDWLRQNGADIDVLNFGGQTVRDLFLHNAQFHGREWHLQLQVVPNDVDTLQRNGDTPNKTDADSQPSGITPEQQRSASWSSGNSHT